MDYQELLIHMELMQMPGIGLKATKSLLLQFGKPSNILAATKNDLNSSGIINKTAIKSILQFKPSLSHHHEIDFINKHEIKVIAPYLDNYPTRLVPIEDAPSLMYSLGNLDLNYQRHVAIIGTRSNTEYGKTITQEIVKQLQQHNIQIISGLAEGIDGIAHKACVDLDLPTIGVLGHGLDTLFPAHHKKLAQQMLRKGGLLTEYPSQTIPHKTNFPMRNRIVAGLADLILVVETKDKGGAMITANLGFQYNKEIGAVPGNINNIFSKGCHKLIKTNIASLIENGEDILTLMNWLPSKKKKSIQKELFTQLTAEQQVVVTILQKENQLHFDEILHKTKLSYSSLSNILLQLELQDYVNSLPGKRYQLSNSI